MEGGVQGGNAGVGWEEGVGVGMCMLYFGWMGEILVNATLSRYSLRIIFFSSFV
jgi:hypothetical protein